MRNHPSDRQLAARRLVHHEVRFRPKADSPTSEGTLGALLDLPRVAV